MDDKYLNEKMGEQDEFISYVEFENEDGDTITLEVVDYFEYENDVYGILIGTDTPDEDEEDVEVCVLKVVETDDGTEFVEPDESIIPDLQEIVERIFAEEADDCDCGCGEHHHEHGHHCDCGCED